MLLFQIEMTVELVRDKQTQMPALPAGVESLRIWHCGYKTLRPLADLRGLRTLVIAVFPDETLNMLGALGDLQYLRIVHLPRVTDLSPLEGLHRLETLSLETLPSWDASGSVTVVDSLDPIGRLAQLKHLSLFGVVPKDRSLAAVQRCRSLVSARFSKYPKPEVQRFYAETTVTDAHVPEPARAE
jgi:hypothetical protein